MLPIRFIAVAGVVGLGLVACSSDEPPAGVKAYYNCGEATLAATFYSDNLDIQLDGKLLRFTQTMAAAGASFYHETDVPQEKADIFWVKDNVATLIKGEDSVYLCEQIAPSGMTSKGAYRAVGNEPGWVALVDGNNMELSTNYGEDKRVVEGVKATPSGKGVRFQAADVTLSVTYELCQDDMSGLYFSDKVTIEVDGKTFNGCGGYLPEAVE